MKFKKSMLILILAVFLLSIAGVCASDVNDTAVASQDDAAMESSDENLITVEDSEPAVSTVENEEILSASADDEIVGVENDLDVLSADSAKYSDLANEVGSGGNIKLKHKYYTYDSGYIMITQSNSVIDGNGAIIDMTGTNIFAFYIDYRALGTTIKNLTIKNSGASEGSGVYAWSPCTIENCSFINNQAWDNGGAVFFRLSGKVINCYFESNRVTGSNGTGGAVYFGGSGEVINCSFNNNSASDGGAILAFNNVLVENCSFINNTANRIGGACFCYGFGDARNCTFVNNSGEFGGALHFVQGQVIDSNFTNNFATIDGGGIYCSGDSNVANCNFINNKASRDGGAIDIEANGNVTNCTFVKNTAVRYAGAVLIYDSNVTNCNFVNNTAGVDSGALLIGEDGVITNCTFVNNSAINENGGAVIIYGTAVVTNCNFTYNTAGNYGGAVLIYSPAVVTNCTFLNNSAINQGGGALYIQENGIVEKCSFTDNSASFGAALIFNNVNCTAKNCYFVNNSASLGGGAVIGSGNIIHCTFVNNSATSGGAIEFDAKGNVTNCSFTGNKASSSGGAIFWRYSGYVVVTPGGVISGCVFVNNSADNGTIYFNNYTSGSNYAINNNIFLNNDGLAIHFYVNDSTSNADYNWFGNNATNYNIGPVTHNVEINAWLFLNATADPDKIGIQDACDIVFRLYAYDSNGVSEYDSSHLKAVNLTVTPTNGRVNTTKTELGESVQFTAESSGIGEITASIENASYTISVPISDGTSFVDLNRTINGNDNDTIVLDRDYTYNPIFDSDLTEGIVINRPLTIVGNGHTLNAAALARIFSIQANNVVIENITFVNGKSDRHGGAIFWSGNKGKISDCIFVNNSADQQGAAINLDGDDSIVSGCTFVNNSAYSGGAVYWSGDNGNVSGCSFVNNSASDGGALTFMGYKGSVSGCSFVNNSARLDGGAIYLDESDEGIVSDCSFENNYADRQGGAISWRYTKDGIVSGCSFVNNSALDGGAIYLENYDNGNVSGSIFVNNRANYGIVYFDNSLYGHLSVNDNIFLNNDGVAIYFVDSDSTSDANYNWFGNNATNYDTEPVTTNAGITAWLFLNATANPDKIGIQDACDIVFRLYAYDSNGVSEYDSSRLKAVNLTVTPTNGRVNTTKTELGESVQFTAESGGIGEITASIENASYTISVPISDGTSFVDLNRTINGNDNDTIVLDNDYIYNPVFDYDLTGGIVINRPVTIIGNGHTLNATGLARIFNIQADNVTIENITFANGKRVDNGGAIFWRGANGNVSGCTFVNNYAKFDGGAIYWIHGYDSIVSNCSFVDNSVQFDGAAMYYVASAGSVVSNCSFEKNSAVERGGAIYIYESNGCTVSDCSFVKNSASKYSGGAIYWDGHNANVSGCSFADNSAKDDGGAIFLTYSEGSVVSDCSFVHNSASNHGGAIFWGRYANDGVVSDCSFADNSARSNGGAIYWNSDKGVVSDCSFVHNSATKNAGALFWYANEGRVSGCIFVNNSAGDKSVIKFYNGENHNLTVNDNIFLNNEGVAISFVRNDSTSNADYNWFGNNATNYDTAPVTNNVEINTWLFLNATANPDAISIFESSEIIFKLYAYNSSEVSEYDNSRLKAVNLTLTSTNGRINTTKIELGEPVQYTAESSGIGKITATIENTAYTTAKIIVKKADVNLTAQDVTVVYTDESGEFVATLTNTVNGKGLVGANVVVSINGEEYTLKTNGKGQVKVSTADLPIGVYTANVSYKGNNRYTPVNANATVTVTKMDTSISVVYEAASNEVVATITCPTTGKGLITANVIVNLDGEDYALKTDGKGQVKVSTADLKSGKYNVTVTYKGNHKYKPSNATVEVSVKSATILSVPDVSVVYGDESGELVATLTNNEGKALVTANVIVTLDGVDYALKTNSKGQVKVSTANLTPGTYKATVSYKGNTKYTPTTTTATVTVNKIGTEITASYDGETNQLVATLTNAETGKGIVLANVIINLDGIDYALKTNSKGQVKVSTAELAPGTYNATATYNGNGKYTSSSTNITITI